jgi:curved DNA-binding protein CbpA
MGKDFYSILDVHPETDKEDIRKAYMQLARQYHPDVSQAPDARDRFEEINQAYTILSDDQTRAFYNLYYEGGQEIFCPSQPLTWWQRYASAIEIGILVFGTLVWIGLFVLLGVIVYSSIS